MTKKEYAEYLQSPEWKRTRDAVRQRENFFCQRCGAPGEDVHHTPRAYRYIQTEENWLDADGDLEARYCELLCRDCHFGEHFPTLDPPTCEC